MKNKFIIALESFALLCFGQFASARITATCQFHDANSNVHKIALITIRDIFKNDPKGAYVYFVDDKNIKENPIYLMCDWRPFSESMQCYGGYFERNFPEDKNTDISFDWTHGNVHLNITRNERNVLTTILYKCFDTTNEYANW